MKFGRTRAGIVAVIAILALLTLVLGRVASEARTELATANAFRREDRIAHAIEHYRRAIRWSFPLSPYAPQAVSQLESIARQLEADGDVAGALLAWRSLAGALAATRFLYSSANPMRESANDEIARLVAMDRAVGLDTHRKAQQLVSDERRLLRERVSPGPWWGTLLLLGMAVWVGALALMAWRGFDSAGRFHWASARGSLWGALAGFVLFALGLLFA